MSRPRSLLLMLSLAVLGIGAVAGWLLLGHRQTAEIAVPGDDASPEQVVTAYLKSLDAHDCETARALATSRARSSLAGWCEDVASVRVIRVESPKAQVPDDADTAVQISYVPVEIDVQWRLFHDDGSMSDGPTIWGYALVRESSRSPWRIYDQGVG